MKKNIESPSVDTAINVITSRIDEHQVAIGKLVVEFSKMRISKYEFMTLWIFVSMEILICIAGLVYMFHKGYPLWTGFSFIYLLVGVIWIANKTEHRNEEYYKQINYDLDTLWNDEEMRLNKKRSLKQHLRKFLHLLPVFIHSGFVARYLYSIGEIGSLGDRWWVVVLLFMLISLLSAYVLGKEYMRSVLNVFRTK